MYIGPWQEFKLAKILQLKDKLDKEAEQDNKLPPQQPQQKALSTGARLQQTYEQPQFVKASNRTSSKQDLRMKKTLADNKFKYKMDPQYAPTQKQVPLLKQKSADTRGMSGKTQITMVTPHGRQQDSRKTSPPGSNYSYVTGNHSTQYTYDQMRNTENKPAQSTGSKASYMTATQSTAQKATLNEYRQQLRNNQSKQLPIDLHYDQWNRFENFLKFASKKEIRDRLKELDPPPLSNYIDPDVIDKIRSQSKPPIVNRKSILSKQGTVNAKEENRIRIEKMKHIYGLYKQFQMQEEQHSQILQPDEQKEKEQLVLPEVTVTPSKRMDEVMAKKNQPEIKLPVLDKPKSDQPSLYNFYQKIIDKNNPQQADSRHSQQMHTNKYKNPSTCQNNQQLEDIQEEIREDFHTSIKMDNRSIRQSCEESEIDGLIKWAKDLPDDSANQSGSSFFKKGL